MNKLGKNYLYNLAYQIIVIISPFIVTPYTSRVLGPEVIGVYSYTQSIVSYFILFGTLGISLFGQREIAYVNKNRDEYSKTFWEIEFIKILTCSISLFFFLLCIVLYKKFTWILLIQSLDILAAAFDISWFFQGIEDFKKLLIRNLLIKIISIGSIFIFIKSSDDILIYIGIFSISLFLGNLSLWSYVPKQLSRPILKKMSFKRHFREILSLFLPQIAIQIYIITDKSMLGLISGDMLESGYYEQSQKVVKLSLTLITSLGTVVASRVAAMYAQKKNEDIKNLIYRSFNMVSFLVFPMFFGLIAVSDLFVPVFFGVGYEKVSILLKIFSFLFIFMSISNITGIQLLLPIGEQSKVTKTVICGAIVNLLLNGVLICSYASVGAAIASIMAEGTVMVYQLYIVRKIINLKKIFTICLSYFSYALFMSLILSLYLDRAEKNVKALIVGILLGCFCYLSITFLGEGLKKRLALKGGLNV